MFMKIYKLKFFKQSSTWIYILLLVHGITLSTTREIDENKFRLNTDHSIISPVNASIDNWMLHGSADLVDDCVKLTPEKQDQRGSIWNKIPTYYNEWIIELTYTSYATETQIADGIALWYVSEVPVATGYHDAYGGPYPQFKGLMIGIDTYFVSFVGAKALHRTVDESAILVVHNEEPRMYNISTEGFDIRSGMCLVKNRYRNATETISTLFIKYTNYTLQLYHKQGEEDLKFCTLVHDVDLPAGGHFGLSATTGGLAGEFSIHSLKFYEKFSSKEGSEAENSLRQTVFILSVIIFILVVSIKAALALYCIKYRQKQQSEKSPIHLGEITKDKLLEEVQEDVVYGRLKM